MKKVAKYISLLLGILWATTGHAHEDWITVSQHFPSVGTEVQIFIGNGHKFPQSETALDPQQVAGIEVMTPSGRQVRLPVHLDAAQQTLRSSLRVEEAGTYVLSYAMQGPRMREPLLLGRTVLISGNDSGRYTQGKGLELAPLAQLSSLRSGGTVALALLLDGERIAGNLTITPEGSRAYSMGTTAERPAVINLNSGKYLITSYRRGQYANFTFLVR